MQKGLFQAVCRQFYRAGLDAKTVSVARWCGDTKWTREMGPLSDSRDPEPYSTHLRMLMTVVLSGEEKDLFFPTKTQCLFFT